MRHHKGIRLVTIVSLAVLILFTSISISVDLHYCRGQLKSFNLMGKAKSCHEVANPESCPHHVAIKTPRPSPHCLEKEGCCSNAIFHVQLLQDIPQMGKDFEEKGTCPFILKPSILTASDKQEFFPVIPYQFYKPPLIYRDIPILVQSFLL